METGRGLALEAPGGYLGGASVNLVACAQAATADPIGPGEKVRSRPLPHSASAGRTQTSLPYRSSLRRVSNRPAFSKRPSLSTSIPRRTASGRDGRSRFARKRKDVKIEGVSGLLAEPAAAGGRGPKVTPAGKRRWKSPIAPAPGGWPRERRNGPARPASPTHTPGSPTVGAFRTDNGSGRRAS